MSSPTSDTMLMLALFIGFALIGLYQRYNVRPPPIRSMVQPEFQTFWGGLFTLTGAFMKGVAMAGLIFLALVFYGMWSVPGSGQRQQQQAETTAPSPVKEESKLEDYLPKPGDGSFTRCAKLKIIEVVKDPMTRSRAASSGYNYDNYVRMSAVKSCQHLDD